MPPAMREALSPRAVLQISATRAAGFRVHLVKPAQTAEIVRLASGGEAGNVVSLRGERRPNESRG